MQAEMVDIQQMAGRRVMVVGGGGDGIGRAITRAIGGAGAAGIAIVGRDAGKGEEAATEVRTTGCRAVVIPADVQDRAAADNAIAAAVDALGRLDVLVTVVGGYIRYARWTPLHATADEDWDRVIDVNLGYVFRFVRAAVRTFLEQATGGTIVAVGSLAGVDGFPKAAAYGVAKAGLINLAKTVSAEYGKAGIRMNVVNSGLVDTAGGRAGVASGVDAAAVPLGRMGVPDEIAQAVLFLASPSSSYVSGQSLNVDGAVSARSALGGAK